MIEVAIMIEGQDGLTWPRWQKIARAGGRSWFCRAVPFRPLHQR